jgi:hypothetical protein
VDPITAPLSECLNDKESITDFFKSISVFVDLDELCIVAPPDIPISQDVCDDLGLLNLFRETRAQALRDKGVDEECINEQVCRLRDRTIADLVDLTALLQKGVFDDIVPDLVKDPKNPDKPALLPTILPTTEVTINSAYDAMFSSLEAAYTEDLIGRRGFFNMCLADSRGRGYVQHLGMQNSPLGPSVFNIYGSRGTRAQPPWDEWAGGAASPASHNSWVDPDGIAYSESTFWRIPFIFNPLAAVTDGSDPNLASTAADATDGPGDVTTGQPPAVTPG